MCALTLKKDQHSIENGVKEGSLRDAIVIDSTTVAAFLGKL